jgi:hypothetical protein
LPGQNALIYSRDKLLQGKQIFGDYVNLLYKYKQQGIKGSKLLLNILWGALCETKTKYISTSIDELHVLSRDSVITQIQPSLVDEQNTFIKMANKEDYFVTNFARMKPFLLAYSRANIINLLRPYEANVVWIHTDGFIINKKIKDITSDKIGGLALEAYGQCNIVHINKVLDEQGNKFSNK